MGARRDDIAYNGLKFVQPERCFADAEKVNKPGKQGAWDERCLDNAGIVTCTAPRPIVRAWYQRDSCTTDWTLNDPADSLPRFLTITIVGAVALVLGCTPMCFLWCMAGCPSKGETH